MEDQKIPERLATFYNTQDKEQSMEDVIQGREKFSISLRKTKKKQRFRQSRGIGSKQLGPQIQNEEPHPGQQLIQNFKYEFTSSDIEEILNTSPLLEVIDAPNEIRDQFDRMIEGIRDNIISDHMKLETQMGDLFQYLITRDLIIHLIYTKPDSLNLNAENKEKLEWLISQEDMMTESVNVVQECLQHYIVELVVLLLKYVIDDHDYMLDSTLTFIDNITHNLHTQPHYNTLITSTHQSTSMLKLLVQLIKQLQTKSIEFSSDVIMQMYTDNFHTILNIFANLALAQEQNTKTTFICQEVVDCGIMCFIKEYLVSQKVGEQSEVQANVLNTFLQIVNMCGSVLDVTIQSTQLYKSIEYELKDVQDEYVRVLCENVQDSIQNGQDQGQQLLINIFDNIDVVFNESITRHHPIIFDYLYKILTYEDHMMLHHFITYIDTNIDTIRLLAQSHLQPTVHMKQTQHICLQIVKLTNKLISFKGGAETFVLKLQWLQFQFMQIMKLETSQFLKHIHDEIAQLLMCCMKDMSLEVYVEIMNACDESHPHTIQGTHPLIYSLKQGIVSNEITIATYCTNGLLELAKSMVNIQLCTISSNTLKSQSFIEILNSIMINDESIVMYRLIDALKVGVNASIVKQVLILIKIVLKLESQALDEEKDHEIRDTLRDIGGYDRITELANDHPNEEISRLAHTIDKVFYTPGKPYFFSMA